MKNDEQRTIKILCILGIIPVVWLALLIAPFVSGGLAEIVAQFPAAMENPFHIGLCEDSQKTVLIFLLIYGLGIGVALSTRRNYRRGEEHGSAKWGSATAVNKKYQAKDPEANKVFTKHVRMGLDGRKHRRNLNTVVVGGSGSGKSRFYALINLLQACSSYFVMDCKGELLRMTGTFLKMRGYEIKVLDLLSMEKSHCFNPFAYLQTDNDVQKLVTSLFKAIPRRVQDVIPIRRIWSDGIFLVGNRYAKTFKFTDINYMVASQESQKNLFLTYAALINSLDCSATTKITLNNHHLNRKNFESTVLMKLRGDDLDGYRQEYNDVIMEKGTGGSGIVQEKYVTVSVCKKSIEDARAYFTRTGAELTARFSALGARVTELDATEKLRLLHDFYRIDEEVYFHFDMQDMMRKGHDFRDYICPDSVEKHSDYLMLGGKYARVIYLKDYASFISDQLVTKLTDQSRSMMLSIDIIPVATDEAVREVERKMLGVETNITNWQRRQNANNNFSAIVPYDMEQQRRETKEYMTDLTSRDQRMMLSVLTIVHLADTKAELDADTDALLKVAADHMCQMAVLRYQQLDGLNTTLPIGTRKIDTFRTLTTESLAVFMPFKVQEIQEPGGIYFGENAISHNLILCNMNNLLNQSMMLLGIPGSGKSFFAKLLIIAIALSTDDDIIILDPEGEYTPLVKALGGSVIRYAVGGSDWVNAMDMENGYGEGSPVAFKSQFIMSLLKQVDPDGIGAHQKSIIDRCVAQVFREQKQAGGVPTLCTVREKLLEQPEPEARGLALTMELYTSGSLDIFAHETNVDTQNRITSHDIHALSEDLKQPGFVTITDAMLNRVNRNWAQGRKTHVFIDEFHIAYENEYSGNFFTSAWRQFRKRNAAPCAITQNVEYLLDSIQASTMLSNSEFIVMLNQAESDQERLSKLLNISPEQMSYVNGAEAGCGLMRYGNALVPFVNRFPADTELYKLITTKPGEGLFAKGQVDFNA